MSAPVYRKTAPLPTSQLLPPLVVHAHFRWDGLWDRPQQHLSRLARRRRVLVIEEPARVEALPRPVWVATEAPEDPNVTVLRTELPAGRFRERAWVDQAHRALVFDYLSTPAGQAFVEPVQWFYDPMQAPNFLGRLDELAVVYDCVDQLSAFRGAPAKLLRREAELLHSAHLVFTGGRRLCHIKRSENPNCHCIGGGVEAAHFEKALAQETVVPSEIAALPTPRLGFFGVADERLDYRLLEAVARTRPEWQLLVVGPLVQVERASLPQVPNLHFLGERSYAELPACLKGCDVCLLPFAHRSVTEFLHPTNALAYMASGRPIVATPIADVVSEYSDIVAIGDSPAAFIARCEEALSQRSRSRIRLGQRRAAEHSWDTNVHQMEKLLARAIAQEMYRRRLWQNAPRLALV